MSVATKEEKAWMRKLEKVLMNPPTSRIGLYTIGDADLGVYDRTKDFDIDAIIDRCRSDFGECVYRCDADLGSIKARMQIHSVAG